MARAATRFPVEEIHRVLASLEEQRRWRDLLLLATGYYASLRHSDFIGLKWGDLLKAATLSVVEPKKVRDGGKKVPRPRKVPVSTEFARIIAACHEGMGKPLPQQSPFLNGKKWRPLTKGGAGHVITKVANEHGIEGDYSTNSMRKAFAWKLYQELSNEMGADLALLAIAEMMNHRSTWSTRKYLNLVNPAELYQKL